MNMAEDRIVELPTLGRPMQLGMLYDCRSDTLIPGLTLWDPDVLQRDRDVRSKHETQFDIISSDSVDNKSTAMGVEASLKASFLGGLVEVKGSGKYLNDRKTSSRQSRLVLQYKTSTRFEQLTMKQLGRDNVQHANVFDQGTATHVVTGLLYGAQAFFVFDRHLDTTEEVKDIEGQMKAMIEKIPALHVEGEGELKMEDKDQKEADVTQCRFYGDFRLEKNPTNYSEAVNLYKELPSKLGKDGEHAVPMTAWLYPLTKLDSNAARLVREVSVNLVSRAEDLLEGLHQSQVKANDMKGNVICKDFPQFIEKFDLFKKHISDYRLAFQQRLARLLPKVRGGGDEEETLAGFLAECENSPFCLHQLDMWLKSKEKEMNVVKAYMKGFASLQVIRSRDSLDELVLSPDIQNLVCFSFPLVGHADQNLADMSEYIKTPSARKRTAQKGWYDDVPLSKKMRIKAKQFKEFVAANSESEETAFAVMALDDGETPSSEGGCIFLYEGGILKTKDFEPPGTPSIPVITDTTHDTVTVKWNPPKVGISDVESYVVKYRESEAYSTKCEEATTDGTALMMTIKDLKPNAPYKFSVAALCPVGVSQSSAESEVCKTLPTSPPVSLKKHQVSKSSITVRWEKPQIVGHNVPIGKYRVKYISVGNTNEDEAQVKETVEPNCVCAVDGLQPSTTYRFWVSALCNDAGSSAFSEPVDVSTTSDNLIIQKLLEHADIIRAGANDGDTIIYRVPLTAGKTHPKNKYQIYSFGDEAARSNGHRVIMVVGATGSGKSTLINGMVNSIFRVDWKDQFRFKIITDQAEDQSGSQARSQTQTIVCYTIYPSAGLQLGYTLTIIDTPGFGDTRGLEQDKVITDHIREFFTNSAEHHIDHIDAIGFVAQASQARLTPTQSYVFDSVLSIFGKDIKDNIMMLVTFADGQRPALTDAIKEAKIPCTDKMYKFNNSALFANNGSPGKSADQGDSFDALFWNMGMQSMQEFFLSLDEVEPKSISLTTEVLKERKQLELTIDGLHRQTQVGCCKMEELKKEQKILQEHSAEVEKNKDFTYTVEVSKRKKVSLDKRNAANCTSCQFTCHQPCMAWDWSVRLCEAFSWGDCTVCPGKCSSSTHYVQDFKHEYYTETEERKYSDLEKKYNEAAGRKMTHEEIVRTHQEELLAVQQRVQQLISESRCKLKRLEEIALRPDPLNTVEYIDMLIRAEEREAKSGWQVRVKALENMRKNANMLEAVQRDGSGVFAFGSDDTSTGTEMAQTKDVVVKGADKKQSFAARFKSWFS